MTNFLPEDFLISYPYQDDLDSQGRGCTFLFQFFKESFGSGVVLIRQQTELAKIVALGLASNAFNNESVINDLRSRPQWKNAVFNKDDQVFKFSSLLHLELWGTPFQISVWQALLKIPKSTTVSYKELAVSIDHPKAYRAVGSAVGKNPLCFIIPCHRVIPIHKSTKNLDSIGHYHWGPALKQQLLQNE